MAGFWSRVFNRGQQLEDDLSSLEEKIVRKSDKSDDSDTDSLMGMPEYSVWKMVNETRDLSDERKSQYAEYDDMERDIIVSSALEMYADDATQIDTKTGKNISIKVKSSDSSLKDDIDRIVDQLEIPNRLWGWAYDLAKRGDVYLQRFKRQDAVKDSADNDEKIDIDPDMTNPEKDEDYTVEKKFDQYIEEIEDPSLIFDVVSRGKTINFIKLTSDESYKAGKTYKEQISILEPDEVVHIYTRKTGKFEKLEVMTREGSTEVKTEYKVVRGNSLIEALRSNYRILQLLEDCLVAAKVVKSTAIRVYQVEVGDSAPKKVKEIIQKVKHLFDARSKINTQTGAYRATKQFRPIDDPVIIPTRNGKGSVVPSLIGGDIDVNSMMDLDYFKNKQFAGLKIPKAFLGFEDSLPGGSGNTTLTKLDIRYARTVKRLQAALQTGIKTLIDYCLIDMGRQGDIDKYEVILTSPSSAEEMDRIQDYSTRLEISKGIIEMINSIVNPAPVEGEEPAESEMDPAKIADMVLRTIMGMPELADIVSGRTDESEEAE